MSEDLFSEIGQFLREEKVDEYILFTEEEYDKILLALLQSAGEEGIQEEDLLKAIRYCELIRSGETLLGLFFKGIVDISWDGKDIVAKLSDHGRDVWEAGQ